MRPYGVFAVICPFNFPFALAVNMAAGALVCGNTVVIKPAEETPWSTAPDRRARGRGRAAAGRPQRRPRRRRGRARAGRGADIDGVAFTGSAEAGHAIARTLHAQPPLRPLIAEMGGKNPAIVTAAADLDRAAAGHRPLGLRAVGPEVQLVLARGRRPRRARRAGRADRRRRARARRRRPGRPGDLARPGRRRRPRSSASRPPPPTRAATARSSLGGEHDGGFVAPTLVTGLPRGHRLTREELFLPFLTVTAVDSLDDALDEANAVDYGLTAGIFSEDPAEQRGVPGPDRGRRRVRQPPRGRHHRRLARHPVVLRLEVQRRRPARAASGRTTCRSSCASRAGR